MLLGLRPPHDRTYNLGQRWGAIERGYYRTEEAGPPGRKPTGRSGPPSSRRLPRRRLLPVRLARDRPRPGRRWSGKQTAARVCSGATARQMGDDNCYGMYLAVECTDVAGPLDPHPRRRGAPCTGSPPSRPGRTPGSTPRASTGTPRPHGSRLGVTGGRGRRQGPADQRDPGRGDAVLRCAGGPLRCSPRRHWSPGSEVRRTRARSPGSVRGQHGRGVPAKRHRPDSTQWAAPTGAVRRTPRRRRPRSACAARSPDAATGCRRPCATTCSPPSGSPAEPTRSGGVGAQPDGRVGVGEAVERAGGEGVARSVTT